jgi:hypothetical protein
MKSYQANLERRRVDQPTNPSVFVRRENRPYRMTIVREAASLEKAREIFENDFGRLYVVLNVVNYLCLPDVPLTQAAPAAPVMSQEFDFDQFFVD